MVGDATVSAGEAARRLGVSTSTIKRWVEIGRLSADKTSGGHRRIPISAIQQLAAEDILQQDQTRLSSWLSVLLQGNAKTIRAHLLAARARTGSWATTAEEVAAAFARLGHSWETGDCSVFEEHISTEALRRALAMCIDDREVPRGAPRAVLMTMEGERHTLGLSLAELLLRDLEVHTIWIGEGPPRHEMLAVVNSCRPDLLVLSGSSNMRRPAVKAFEEVP